jgi:hypothetical protein
MVCVTPSTQGKEDERVQRLAFGAVGTRSRAIRRNTSMKLRIQELDRPPASCLIMSYLDLRRRIARERVPRRRTLNAERRTLNASYANS